MSVQHSTTEMASRVAHNYGLIMDRSKEACSRFLVDRCRFQQDKFIRSSNGRTIEGKCFGFSLEFLILISTKHKDNPVAALQEMRSPELLPAPGQILHEQYDELRHLYKEDRMRAITGKGSKHWAKQSLLHFLFENGRFPPSNTQHTRFYLADYELRKNSPIAPHHAILEIEDDSRRIVSVHTMIDRTARIPPYAGTTYTSIPKRSTAQERFKGTETKLASREAIDFAYDAFAGDVYNFILETRKTHIKYFQISVRLMEGGKHALALFMNDDAYYIFDPNTGLHKQDIPGLPEYRQDGGTPHELLLHTLRSYAADRVAVLCIQMDNTPFVAVEPEDLKKVMSDFQSFSAYEHARILGIQED